MSRPHTRRALLASVGTAAGLGLAGCSGLQSGVEETPHAPGSPNDGPTEPPSTTPATEGEPAPPDGPVASLSVDRLDGDYAHLGAADAPETATLYGGWKCPYTREFVDGMLPEIVEEYVQPGELAIEFRAVRFQAGESYGADEPRANRAGLAVWHEVPRRFPEYVAALFADQPPETETWATEERLLSFARAAGVEDTDSIATAIEDEQYGSLWRESQSVVEEKGIEGIPRLELGGEITAPTIDPAATRAQLQSTLE